MHRKIKFTKIFTRVKSGLVDYRLDFSRPPYFKKKKKDLTSLVAQMVKCLPTMQESQVRSLGWEDPLVKEMATHSSTLTWKIPWTEELGRLQSMGSQRVGHN